MTVRRLDRGGGQPLWKQLQRDLVRRLRSGEFDDAFPGELALVDEYEVSRHTVRQALGQLRSDGLIVAERGRQPRVATAPEIRQPMGALYSLFSSVEASGLPQHSVVRALDIRADGVIAARLDLEGSSPLLYLERIRYAGDEPLALDDRPRETGADAAFPQKRRARLRPVGGEVLLLADAVAIGPQKLWPIVRDGDRRKKKQAKK